MSEAEWEEQEEYEVYNQIENYIWHVDAPFTDDVRWSLEYNLTKIISPLKEKGERRDDGKYLDQLVQFARKHGNPVRPASGW